MPHSDPVAKREYHREYARKWRAAHRDELRAYHREWHRKHASYYQENWVKWAHGMTQAESDALLAKQGGVCGICRCDKPTTKRRWYVDHDHKTGKIRGLLCQHCNSMLGFGRDDAERLRAAAAYLERKAVI